MSDNGGSAFQGDLRDWFAGQALPGVLTVLRTWGKDGSPTIESTDDMAKMAYLLADSMLKERNHE
jgi:hypothetical protein